MHPLLNHPRLLHALHDRAHAEARELRREALADFWRGADALLDSTWAQARRSAQRLAHRLQRRAALPVEA